MADLHPLLVNRKSGRVIDSQKKISESDTLSLLEAARWAPSCANKQPWRIVVSQNESLDDVKSCLPRGNSWALNAPLILVFASKTGLACEKEDGRDYFPLDLGLAIENVLLQGMHLGLVMHPIAGFDEQGVKEVINLPEPYRIYALVVAGHAGKLENMDERTIEKESAPRKRKKLEEIVFREKWK